MAANTAAWENTKSLVVRDKAQPAALFLLGPADEALPRTHAERSGPEADERDPLVIFQCDVAQDPPGQAMAQEVVLVEQLVEARHLIGRDEADNERVESSGAS